MIPPASPDDQIALEREQISPALARVASGLYIATAQIGEEPIGLLCSFVQQCGFFPPLISIAVAPDRPIVEALDGHGLFGLHPLGTGDTTLVKAFSHPHAANPFAGLTLIDNLFGIPQIAEATSFLACKVAGKHSHGDHTLYIAEVFEGALQHPENEPLIRKRVNGFDY
jgi:flavin reductase (DIM6/NTAB) family NADH-FMN oxidoreductase RutF